MKKFFKKENKKGFTLIELMVSISIFTVIMLIAMGSIFIALNSVKKARAMRVAMDNINFAMDSMSRSIRLGTNYTCGLDYNSLSNNPLPLDCPNGSSRIAFIPQKSEEADRYFYGLNESDKSIQRCVYKDNSNPICNPLNDPNVKIESLKFFVTGATTTDLKHPMVYITMKGSVNVLGEDISFAMQTLASQRNLE